MKKIISLILSLVMILSFTACGTKAEAGWKEQYDLGVKYVNEAKYEEAILAFTKALEIDPKQAPVYIALAEVYVRQENYTAAAETLDKAIAEIGETSELIVAKENLNWWQVPQGIIPPQSIFTLSVDEVVGVKKTERVDHVMGGYHINGYSEMIDYSADLSKIHKICEYNYNENGKLNYCYIITYYTDGNCARYDHYNADGSLDHYVIYTYDEDGNHISSNDYNCDGSSLGYRIYTINANGKKTGYTDHAPDGDIIRVIEW